MLLAQVLFISYLEHRGIVGHEYQQAHNLQSLHNLVATRDGRSIDRLIAQLKSDFNGDFLEPKEITWSKLPNGVLGIVDDLLSRVNLETGQLDFWNYDFSQIPVELLSGIYETFLRDDQKVDGAYYTPRMLAELAVEQAFRECDDLSKLRIYDGACGSGILLTTAFRNILASQQSLCGRLLNINERITLLEATIFGSDINEIACRVTAFSLYLCLVERLTDSDLSQLQQNHDCKLPKLIGRNIQEGREKGDFFSPKNSFSSSHSFDIAISNPPWRELRGTEGNTAVRWALHNKVKLPHKQVAASFAAKACDAVKPGGRIVLILPSSLITAPTNADFLRQYSVRVTIDRLINLADFRRLLFANAEHACTILEATNRPGIQDRELPGNFDYWMPKVDLSFAFNRLTLHEYDILSLPRVSLIDDNSILRRRFWGSQRDEDFIGRLSLLPQLNDAIERNKTWTLAKGYHFVDGDKHLPADPLKRFRYLPTNALNSASPIVDHGKLISLPVERGIASYGDTRMYSGPRVLWPDGTSTEIEIRAAFSDARFCFSSAVGGLKVTSKDRGVARFLACYLRSSLAKYWLILTGYSASAERARVTLKEIKSLPFIEPSLHSDETLAERVLVETDMRLNALETAGAAIFASSSYEFVRDGIDELVFDYFGLTNSERILVRDTIDLVAKSLQPTSYAELRTPLQQSIDQAEIAIYLRQLKDSLSGLLRNSDWQLSAMLFNKGSSSTPLDVVHISVFRGAPIESPISHARTLNELLKSIAERVSSGRSLDFFAIPNSIFIWGDDIYVIKPTRKRFWTASAALRDSDEILGMLSSIGVSS